MRIKSAVDIWIRILFYSSVFIMLLGVFFVGKEQRFFSVIFFTLFSGFILWLLYGTYYEFREEYLYCRCGPFYEKIPYDKIKTAKLTRNMLSSMALSSKRIEIRQHGKGYVCGTTLISPINREEFLIELRLRCRNLQI